MSELAQAHLAGTSLAVVAEIGAALSASHDVASLVATLQGQLKWLLPASFVAVSLLTEDGRAYRSHTADGPGTPYPLEVGLVGWVLAHGVPLDVPNLQDRAALPRVVSPLLGLPGRGALLILPLRHGAKHGSDQPAYDVVDPPLGVLAVGSPHPRTYVDVDRRLINLLVLQVASAVRTLLLLGELDSAEAVIAGMARAVEAKDPYTRGHADRVTTYALALAAAAGLPRGLIEIIARAGPLHDVGKIGVPDQVLGKPGPLDTEERALMELHPSIGDEICSPLRSLRRLRAGVRHHHERYDGLGYPDRLGGRAIPLEARVLAIADAYDAMTSDRPYRAGMPKAKALSIIGANTGPQWDPALVPLFCRIHRQVHD